MSNSIARIEEPVTGREQIADPAQPQYALSQFYRALNARDGALMEQNWDGSPEAAMDNPLGGIKRGWADIRQTYEALFATPWAYSFEFWDYTLHRGTDVFWVVGRERGRLSKPGETLELAIRTTRLFRWVGGRWRQIHHHGSIDDPQMLASYLAAVRQSRQ
jgi:ketosteroid isomerase-like protein